MADVATPTASVATAAGGAVAILPLASIGLDPASMVAGLVGVVISQTLAPRTQGSVWALAGIAVGSMLLASFAAPFLGPGLISLAPESWAWVRNVPPDHVKAVAAGAAGGFAQPFFLWLKSLVPKPKPTEPAKEG